MDQAQPPSEAAEAPVQTGSDGLMTATEGVRTQPGLFVDDFLRFTDDSGEPAVPPIVVPREAPGPGR